MTEDTPFAETVHPAVSNEAVDPAVALDATPSLPTGVPPLLPPGIETVLGGKPIPMRVGRVAPAVAAPPAGPVPAGFSPTLTGEAPLDPVTRSAVAECRATLSRAVAAMTAAEAELPGLIARIEPAEDDAAALAHFDLSQVRRFLANLTTALAELRA